MLGIKLKNPYSEQVHGTQDQRQYFEKYLTYPMKNIKEIDSTLRRLDIHMHEYWRLRTLHRHRNKRLFWCSYVWRSLSHRLIKILIRLMYNVNALAPNCAFQSTVINNDEGNKDLRTSMILFDTVLTVLPIHFRLLIQIILPKRNKYNAIHRSNLILSSYQHLANPTREKCVLKTWMLKHFKHLFLKLSTNDFWKHIWPKILHF